MRQFLWRWTCKTIMFMLGWSLDKGDYQETPRQVMLFPHSSGWELVYALLCIGAYDLKDYKIIVWNGQFWGPVGFVLEWLGCIPIENRKSVGGVKTISDFLNKHNRFRFCISPEGSRSYRENFRSGFFHIAKNTNAVYNIILFDYENHVIRFGKSIQPTDSFENDCEKIKQEFSKGVHLHPSCVSYGCAPHKTRSAVNWRRVILCLIGLNMGLFTLLHSWK